jgi:hypothetical protein
MIRYFFHFLRFCQLQVVASYPGPFSNSQGLDVTEDCKEDYDFD